MDQIADRTIETLKSRLSKRNKASIKDPSLSSASVLLLLYSKNGEHCVLLNKRTDQVEHHKGEISLPGGGRDSEDRDSLDTALREAHEEMGISPDDVTILGQLDDVVTSSQYLVRVYLGTIDYPYLFKPSPREVEEVIEIPLKELLDPANLREEAKWVDGTVTKTHTYAYGDHIVWGATARIVGQFLELIPDYRTGSEESAV